MFYKKLLKSDRVKDLVLSIWIILVSIPYTMIFPLLLVFIALPIKLYSRIIAYIAYVSDPDKGNMITGLGASQIRDIDDIHTKPRTAEVCCLRMMGPLDYNEIMEAFDRRVIVKLDKNNAYPVLHYPELQQYFTKFLGYVFLKKDNKFDIRNHFKFYNENSRTTPVTRSEIMQVWEELMVKPFPKNRSCWEIVLVDNYAPDEDEIETWKKATPASFTTSDDHFWVAFIRLHHGLADGFSVQRMLSFLTGEVFVPKFSVKTTPFHNFLMTARTVVLGPYDVVWRWYRGRESYHGLHLPFSKQSGDYYVIESKLIPTKRVKIIKDKFGVPFTNILVSAISGGLRKYFLKYKVEIPEYLSAVIPIATLEHSDKLTNEFLLATVEYAVNLDDPKARVDYVQEKMTLLATTSWINMLNFIVDILGNLPQPILKKLTEKQIFSSTYSTQPGPEKSLTSFGSTLLEVNYSYGSATFGISTLTYNGNFRMVLFIDKNAVESRKAAEDIIKFISEEFDVLEQYHCGPDFVKKRPRKLNWSKSIELD